MGKPALYFHDHHPTPTDLGAEVLAGLGHPNKYIPPKFFYDLRGSQLFEAICKLPEYYLTRTEVRILKRHAGEIAQYIGENCLLIELGSGSIRKVRILLEALHPAVYMPLDISKEHLLDSARSLAADYPWLEVHATCVDYSKSFRLPHCPPKTKKIAFFPGSSIGNFEPSDARDFLQRLVPLLEPDGGLLIGVDLKKSPDILNAAYNDPQGLTSAFNLNLLRRINRELQANFQLDRFRHQAFYNEEQGRIEMHLVSLCQQPVKVAGKLIQFKAGESIHTENSYKYTIAEFQDLARSVGLQPVQVWTDSQSLFSVHYFQLTSL